MTLEYIHCPLCSADNSQLVFKRKDLRYRISDEEFCVVQCRDCGMAYVNPRPTEAEIHTYYPEELYEPDTDPEQLLHKKHGDLVMQYQYVSDMPPGRLLEIGCAKGEFMEFMRQKGWDVHGLDFSTKPPNIFGLDVFYGSLESARYQSKSFDLVAMWAVLEHIYNPKEMLGEINRILKPGAKFITLVTNFNSLPAHFMRHDDVPRHTMLFTKRTMREMLRRTEFQLDAFYFNSELYGGKHRGVLNYLVKLTAGEKIEDILSSNRSAADWYKFSSQLHGKDSNFMLKVDRADIAVTPYLDRLMDKLQMGFIMIVKATKIT